MLVFGICDWNLVISHLDALLNKIFDKYLTILGIVFTSIWQSSVNTEGVKKFLKKTLQFLESKIYGPVPGCLEKKTIGVYSYRGVWDMWSAVSFCDIPKS